MRKRRRALSPLGATCVCTRTHICNPQNVLRTARTPVFGTGHVTLGSTRRVLGTVKIPARQALERRGPGQREAGGVDPGKWGRLGRYVSPRQQGPRISVAASPVPWTLVQGVGLNSKKGDISLVPLLFLFEFLVAGNSQIRPSDIRRESSDMKACMCTVLRAGSSHGHVHIVFPCQLLSLLMKRKSVVWGKTVRSVSLGIFYVILIETCWVFHDLPDGQKRISIMTVTQGACLPRPGCSGYEIKVCAVLQA